MLTPCYNKAWHSPAPIRKAAGSKKVLTHNMLKQALCGYHVFEIPILIKKPSLTTRCLEMLLAA